MLFPPENLIGEHVGTNKNRSILKSKLRYQDIFVELPIQVHNSHLLTSFLHQVPQAPPAKTALDFPSSLAELSRDPDVSSNPFAPNLDSLDLSIDPFLEKSCDLMLDSIENHQTEQNNFQYWQRGNRSARPRTPRAQPASSLHSTRTSGRSSSSCPLSLAGSRRCLSADRLSSTLARSTASLLLLLPRCSVSRATFCLTRLSRG
jgi:hypothetical protein